MILLCSFDKNVREHWLNGLAAARMAAEPVAGVKQLHRRLNGSVNQLVMLHLDMPGVEAVGLVSDLMRRYPSTRIYAMTSKPDPVQGVALARAGVRGYGNCWMHPVTLSQSVSLIQSGELWLGQEVIQHLIRGVAGRDAEAADPNPQAVQRLAELTSREHEIAQRIAGGENNKQIGNALGITERTVKAHLGNIFKKTGTKNRLQLALLANAVSPLPAPMEIT